MVSTSPLVKTYTLEEFWELPEPLDHSKLELIAGVLYMTPPPGYLHNNSVSRLVRLLVDYQMKIDDQGKVHVPRAGIVKGRIAGWNPTSFTSQLTLTRFPIPSILNTSLQRIWLLK
jgi:Uma2 family endonuclease